MIEKQISVNKILERLERNLEYVNSSDPTRLETIVLELAKLVRMQQDEINELDDKILHLKKAC